MPRMDYRVSVETELLSEESRLVLALLLDEVNQLRFWAGQPALTEDSVRAKIRQYRLWHPRIPLPRSEES